MSECEGRKRKGKRVDGCRNERETEWKEEGRKDRDKGGEKKGKRDEKRRNKE
ncbi:hypothetical protein B7P43_G12678 [Cryptotermes secundus]|uniref:Uncharacterized protein n=1 Tax=Cryptotermes secundus TaxID=105785 RepID=A0A2J7REZ5_9NEOP|nr:hypothetical protein B7P43_G12678 [Cryptotermes secundus]